MKSTSQKLLLTSLTAAILVGVALVAQQKPVGAAMTEAANDFLTSLNPELKSKAQFGFDDAHRQKWYFTPQQDKMRNSTRKGVRYDQLDEKQKEALHGLLKTALSETGFKQAVGIMGLESILADLEGDRGSMVRDPNWYFVSIFGEPSNTGSWGWRFEGHHLSLNFTLNKGQVVSVSPVVFGVNPAKVKDGPKKGLRVTPEIEDTALVLIASLSDEQKKLAKQEKQLPEIQEGRPDATVGKPIGITLTQLEPQQRRLMMEILYAYADRLNPQLKISEVTRIRSGGAENLYFAYAMEEDKPGEPYTYRLQGQDFVIEFLNVQRDAAGNPANHIHSGWRKLPNDFKVEAGQ